MRLLNPHGSDETSETVPTLYFPFMLLNPHGSDETEEARYLNKSIFRFLTHTVQMKLVMLVIKEQPVYSS